MTDAVLNEKYSDYIKELGQEEITEQFILSENEEFNLFNKLLGFIESSVLPTADRGLIFAQTLRSLRFYRNYLR